ncbi:MAG TPA: M50 family metallopeptidase [Terriglobales bacterium]|jgi:Zn-dependent protease|nr:M50 family metallopeptidase [Terriglobales bacterium]
MPTGRQGSIHLFRFSGIDVFLHWSWFLVAVYEIQSRAGGYSSVAWNILEYLALFVIVTLHEFGHALACRQVGGRANRIVLWPLGGVAYVDPPPRPGATLWSIAAGPLVNVALIAVFEILLSASRSRGWAYSTPDVYRLILNIRQINIWLLVFNVLPIYPLDGGQILRSLLWFVMGRAWSLMVAAVLGLIGAAGFIILAIYQQSAWLGVIAAFVLLNCWGGFKNAQALLRFSKLPVRHGYSCPTCKTSPPLGPYWRCANCGQAFDTFESRAVCPHCSAQYPNTQCLNCGSQHPLSDWAVQSTIVVHDPTTV